MKHGFTLLLAIFVAGRLALALLYRTDDTDLKLYAQYAMELRHAQRLRVPFYEYHARYIDTELEAWRRAGGPELPSMVRIVEYPPPAIGWIALPTLFTGPPPPDGTVTRALADDYKRAYRALMFAADLATFLLLAALTRRNLLALALYTITGAVLYHVVYDRLDLVLGALLLAALALLRRRDPIWSYLVLAAAIGFKVVPIILLPIWAAGALPAAVLAGGRAALARALGAKLALLGAVVAATMLPFYLAAGPAGLSFLTYHQDRGIQIESTWSALLMLLGLFGHEVEVVQGFGSYNVTSSLAPALLALSTFVLAAALAATTALFLRATVRRAREGATPDTSTLAAWTAIFLLTAMIFSKVLSPQYMLWLVPLVPAALANQQRPLTPAALFLAACALTTAIFPHHYPTDIARLVVGPFLTPDLLDPTPLGEALIITRNVVLVSLAVVLVLRAFSRTPG